MDASTKEPTTATVTVQTDTGTVTKGISIFSIILNLFLIVYFSIYIDYMRKTPAYSSGIRSFLLVSTWIVAILLIIGAIAFIFTTIKTPKSDRMGLGVMIVTIIIYILLIIAAFSMLQLLNMPQWVYDQQLIHSQPQYTYTMWMAGIGIAFSIIGVLTSASMLRKR